MTDATQTAGLIGAAAICQGVSGFIVFAGADQTKAQAKLVEKGQTPEVAAKTVTDRETLKRHALAGFLFVSLALNGAALGVVLGS